LLDAEPFVEALLATALLALDLRRAALAERDLARVAAALLAAAGRARVLCLLLLLALVEPARELGVDSAMVSPPGIG
jgi:hypothetical protein